MEHSKNYRIIQSCRLCQTSELDLCFDFGKVPLGNNLLEIQTDSVNVEKYPLYVNRCRVCDHFQLGVAVDPEKLYATNYTYLSGVGKSFIKHFQEYAVMSKKKCNLSSDSLVVDIGSNDGTCLKEFKNLGLKVCGVDPASAPADIANAAGIDTLNCFFDKEAVTKIINKYGKADFITSHNVLAHVDNLSQIFIDIYSLLKDGGYFCFEIGYFKEVLKNNYFDTIYHEHLDYHHAKPLTKFLCSIGFDLIDLSVNKVQGGSLRLFLKKTGDGSISPEAKKFLDGESESILYQDKLIKEWQPKLKSNMMAFGNKIKEYASNGKIVAGYGAPTKATLLSEIAELDSSSISFIMEDNTLKVNKFMPSTGIPIVNTSKLIDEKPEVIVIFAWNFSKEIIDKIKSKINWPATILVPLPEFHEESL
jgi:SAM-dependent methyltransferase